MTPERWQAVQALFEKCASLTAIERSRLLADESLDKVLRADVRHLLDNLDRAGENFLAPPQAVLGALTRPPLLQPGDVLSDRFRVESLLGRGGMGEVYRAFDTELNEPLALKVLQLAPHLGREASSRFRRELQLSRRITHPNVCRVFEIGRHAFGWGQVEFFTMELIEGIPLSAALKERGTFAVADAAPILQQILAGLRAAHQMGIVHRDLKPGNIMLGSHPGGAARAVVMDFGLARAEESAATSLTGTGDIIGTLAYISPEELTGGEISPRTDLYSFGLIWYEMLTGKRPFRADSKLADALARLHQPVTIAASANLPAGWRQGIDSCLAIDPAYRPPDAGSLLPVIEEPSRLHRLPKATRRLPPWLQRKALGWTVAAAAIVGIVNLPVTRVWEQWRSPVPAIRHVALLPVETTEDAGVSLGDAVAAQLVRAERADRNSWIIPPSDLRAQDAQTPDAVKARFPVNLLVRTSLRRDPRNVALKLDLVDAGGKILRSREIVSPADQLFRLSGLMATELATMLRIQPPESPAQLVGTNIAEAFRAAEAGRAALVSRDLKGTERAIESFQLAVELDRSFALGFAGLADAHTRRFTFTKDPSELMIAEENAKRASEIDPGHPDVHRVLAQVHAQRGRQDAAIVELKRALQLDPNDPTLSELLGNRYRALGKSTEAEAAYRRAVELRPSYWSARNALGSLYYRQGRYADAETEFRKVTEILPTQPLGYINLGGILALTGRCREAIQVFEKALKLAPPASAYSNLGTCHFELDDFARAAQSFEQATQLSPKEHVAWRNLGDAYGQMAGRQGDAMAAYAKALAAAEEALAANPHDLRALSGAALYHAKLDNAQSSEAIIHRVDGEKTVDVNAIFRLAIAEELNGRRPAALRRLGAALDKGLSLSELNAAWELKNLRRSQQYKILLQEREGKKK